MALNVNMDIGTGNITNSDDSFICPLVKMNDSSCNATIKHEPNITISEEKIPEEIKGTSSRMLSNIVKINDSSYKATIKHEPNITISEEKLPEEIKDINSTMLCKKADVKIEQCDDSCDESEDMTEHNTAQDINTMNTDLASLTGSTHRVCDSDQIVAVKYETNMTFDEHVTNAGQTNQVLLKYNKDKFVGEEISNIKKWNELWDEPIDVPAGLSKRQKKNYIRNVLWHTKWKPLKRAKEKEKLKQKKLLARINNETLGPSRKKLKHSTMAASKCKLRIVLDFSFDDLMSEKDLGKCLKQLNHCYCLNRRAANPLQVYVTNFSGAARDQLGRGVAYNNWDINFHEINHLDLFKKEDLVYLTSDSENTLTHLDHSKAYIIGALVDHNKYKGKTLEIARNQGINHAKLPISEFLQMNSRSVLTIDHVFEILVHASEGISWKDSFLKVLPQRKRATEKV